MEQATKRGMRQRVAAGGLAALAALAAAAAPTPTAQAAYFRMPAVWNDTLVFVAEGDLWRASLGGGLAQRLTTHHDAESFPAISADGQWLAFTARYEGASEVYVMPLFGGAPRRLTFDGGNSARVQGWTPDGKVLYASTRFSGKPQARLFTVDPATSVKTALPLAEAAEGCYLGDQLIFSRRPVLGDNVKGYKGGRAQSIWRFDGKGEAVPLTADWAGTSRQPMCVQGRVYFLADRDGAVNLWSMDASGKSLKQHTKHKDWDIRGAAYSPGKIVYQLGADLYSHDLANGTDRKINLALASDFDQLRTRWIKTPWDYVSDLSLSPNGDRVAITARGQVFVTPAGAGRRVEITRPAAGSITRARKAKFMPDGKTIVALHDGSGEVELARYPANGVGESKQLTSKATVIRRDFFPSPDGKWIAHHDKDLRLFLHNVTTGQDRHVDTSLLDAFDDFAWSPDSRWLVYSRSAENQFDQLWLMEAATGAKTLLTSDRYHSKSPVFSQDGKWLFFISARNLQSTVTSPWGQRNPEPFFDRQDKIYGLALDRTARWPFLPNDELQKTEPEKKPEPDKKPDDRKTEPAPAKPAEPATPPTPDRTPAPERQHPPELKPDDQKNPPPTPTPVPAKPAEKTGAEGNGAAGGDAKSAAPAAGKPGSAAPASGKPIVVHLAGLRDRLYEVPLAAGNYSALDIDGKRLYFFSAEAGPNGRRTLRTLSIEAPNPNPPTMETFFDDVRLYELSLDKKKVLLRRANDLWVVDAGAKAPADLSKAVVNLRDFTFQLDPRLEWKQMFADAWRMHRDFFYDKNMHGVDWKAMRAKYEPLVDRVTDRAELNDVIAQMVSEVALLHSQVFSPDLRRGNDEIDVAALAADLTKVANGYRVDRLFGGDPELLEERSPLDRPEASVKQGEVLTHINGVSLNEAPPGELLRNQAGKQVLVTVRGHDGRHRDIIVTPVNTQRDGQLRYLAWEWESKTRVEEKSKSRIGYVHLQAMTAPDIARWAREFYPVFQREGLILDLRGNGGGSIDSWIVEKLQRRAWGWWRARASDRPFSNQQVTFRGHVVALIDDDTYSDGETMAEALKRLGIATLVGTRTSGAGVWLSDQNRLRDNGLARAAESGQFVPGSGWIIEGTGVTPDVVVENLPHATFKGGDAQLDAAIKLLEEKIAKQPLPAVTVPPYPTLKR
jgi:tricorn protease